MAPTSARPRSARASEEAVGSPHTPPPSCGAISMAPAAPPASVVPTQPPDWAVTAYDATGARSFGAVGRLYGRALPAISLLVAWLFGIYAAIGYTFPKVLCKDAVESKEVRACI